MYEYMYIYIYIYTYIYIYRRDLPLMGLLLTLAAHARDQAWEDGAVGAGGGHAADLDGVELAD